MADEMARVQVKREELEQQFKIMRINFIDTLSRVPSYMMSVYCLSVFLSINWCFLPIYPLTPKI